MARDRKAPDAEVKNAEKARAKRNRENFKDIIHDLSKCVGNDNLSINKCLSTAVSIFKLDKFYPSGNYSTSKELVTYASAKPSLAKEFSHLLLAVDCFGLGFNEKGTIIYASPNFKSTVGYKDCVLGESLGRYI